MRYVPAIGVLVFGGALACATTAKYEAMLDTWKGDDVNNLMMAWGAPARTFKMPNGMTVYEYHYEGGASATTTYNQALNQSYTNANSWWCKTSFFAMGQKITTWQWQGNACKSK